MKKIKYQKAKENINPVQVTNLFNDVQEVFIKNSKKISRLDAIAALQMLLQFETDLALQQAVSEEAPTQRGVR